jgi:adenylate kinase
MRVLLVGAPGSGKGTQADQLSAQFGVPHISSGQLLRDHMVRGTEEGRRAAEFVDAGDLVPDELVEAMLREPVRRAAERGGYILDGFPRTLTQAQHVQLNPDGSDFAVQAAVHLDVAHDELVRRLLARARGVDDSRAVIEHRLEVFEKHTRPMLDFFEQRGELVNVDAAQAVDEVTATIVQKLQALSVDGSPR